MQSSTKMSEQQQQQQPERVPCAVEDHLAVDDPIVGQRFVCISFLSPEDAIRDKDSFVFEKFAADRAAKLGEMIDELSSMSPEAALLGKAFRERHSAWFDPAEVTAELIAFKADNFDSLNREYLEKNAFQTSMRGFKVRGSYDSEKEARDRAHAIRAIDPDFDVFVAMVGAWCPWSPSEATVKDVVYQETELNSLMKTYREGHERKGQAYADETATKVAAAIAHGKATIVSEEDIPSASAPTPAESGPVSLPLEMFN